MLTSEFDCIEHTVLDGQRWDTLAWIYYGDATAYGRIVQANPALDITTHLDAGTVVLLSVLSVGDGQEGVEQDSLPPWKR